MAYARVTGRVAALQASAVPREPNAALARAAAAVSVASKKKVAARIPFMDLSVAWKRRLFAVLPLSPRGFHHAAALAGMYVALVVVTDAVIPAMWELLKTTLPMLCLERDPLREANR